MLSYFPHISNCSSIFICMFNCYFSSIFNYILIYSLHLNLLFFHIFNYILIYICICICFFFTFLSKFWFTFAFWFALFSHFQLHFDLHLHFGLLCFRIFNYISFTCAFPGWTLAALLAHFELFLDNGFCSSFAPPNCSANPCESEVVSSARARLVWFVGRHILGFCTAGVISLPLHVFRCTLQLRMSAVQSEVHTCQSWVLGIGTASEGTFGEHMLGCKPSRK